MLLPQGEGKTVRRAATLYVGRFLRRIALSLPLMKLLMVRVSDPHQE